LFAVVIICGSCTSTHWA